MAHVEKNKYANSLTFCFPEIDPDMKFQVAFNRTYRLPDDGKKYPLPPGLGNFELEHVEDYKAKVPSDWAERGGVMLPMFNSEAMWIGFTNCTIEGEAFPFAVKVSAGMRSAVTGDKREAGLRERDYMVTLDQKWLDGFVVDKGIIRQFVAVPLGSGATVEEQLSGKAEFGGLQIEVFPMRKDLVDAKLEARRVRNAEENIRRRHSLGRIGASLEGPQNYSFDGILCSDSAPLRSRGFGLCGADSDDGIGRGRSVELTTEVKSMGMGAGGQMTQQVYDDTLGYETWDRDVCAKLCINLVDDRTWKAVVGRPVRHAALNKRDYDTQKFTWYDYYAPTDTLSATNKMTKVKSVETIDKGLVGPQPPKHPSGLPVTVIGGYQTPVNAVKDGSW